MEVTSISSQFLFQSFRSFSVSLPYILTIKNICCPSSICLYLYKYTQLLSARNTYRIHYQVYPSWQTIFSWKPSKIQRVKFTVMTKKLPIVIEAVYNNLLTNIPNIWNSLPKTVTGSTSFSTLQKRWWNFLMKRAWNQQATQPNFKDMDNQSGLHYKLEPSCSKSG